MYVWNSQGRPRAASGACSPCWCSQPPLATVASDSVSVQWMNAANPRCCPPPTAMVIVVPVIVHCIPTSLPSGSNVVLDSIPVRRNKPPAGLFMSDVRRLLPRNHRPPRSPDRPSWTAVAESSSVPT